MSKKNKNKIKKIDRLFREKWQGKSVTLDLDGTDIIVDITSQTRQHFSTMNNVESYRSYKARMKYVLSNDLIDLMSSTTYKISEIENKNEQNKIHKNTKEWHYFTRDIYLDNKTYEVIFNIRESSQIQGLFVLHAVSFKETSLENQQTVDIKKSERATLACSANYKSSSASRGSLSNKDELVNINLEKYYSTNSCEYRIPYKDSIIQVKDKAELADFSDYENIGWNMENMHNHLSMDIWLSENSISEHQKNWLSLHAEADNITYSDINVNNSTVEKLCDQCKTSIAGNITQAALIVNGYPRSSENYETIEPLVRAGLTDNNFNSLFVNGLKEYKVAEIIPYIQNWVAQLPESGQIWASKLSENAKAFYDTQDQGRIALNVADYIDNNANIQLLTDNGILLDLDAATKNQITTYLIPRSGAAAEAVAEKEKIVENEL